MSDAKKMMTKKQVMELCDIKRMDVAALELGESLAKPKSTPGEPDSKGRAPAPKKAPVYDEKAQRREVEKLRDFVKEKALRSQIIKKKPDARMTQADFVDKLLVKELKYAAKACRETDALTQAFQTPRNKAPEKDSMAQEEPAAVVWISVKELKKAMEIKEEKLDTTAKSGTPKARAGDK